MKLETITFEVLDKVAVITLNRPDAANALDVNCARELLRVAIHCDANPAIRAVLLTGNGKMFCGGGDIPSFAVPQEPVGIGEVFRDITAYLHAAISRLQRMDAPVVIAVNGAAAGAGMSLAITGDVVFAAASAKFSMAYTALGVCPDGSSSFFLPRLVGMLRAKELMLLNRRLSAAEAQQLGLVTEVVADEELLTRAMACARQLAEGPTKAYGTVKRLLVDSFNNSLETQMEYETRGIAELAAKSEDAKEGIAAFLAKRKPTFNGR